MGETGISARKGAGFPATRWSVVLAAGDPGSARRLKALEELCSAYWRPLYSFLRVQGQSPEQAEDLTQDFFAHLLGRKSLASLSPEKGLFRSYLLAALKHFLADARDRANAVKRGCGQPLLCLDEISAEGRAIVPDLASSPEQGFDRQWALTVLDRAFHNLQEEYVGAGKAEVFEQLREYLSREGSGAEYDRVGANIGLSGGAVAVAVHRMRRNYRAAVRHEVAQTVANPWELDEEMHYLLELINA